MADIVDTFDAICGDFGMVWPERHESNTKSA